MDDVKNLALLAADRKVARTPVPFLESAAFGLGAANVVLLHGHRVRSPIPQNPIQRCPEVLDSRSIRIIGVVGEYLEQASPDDIVSSCHRRTQVCLADRKNFQIGVQH